MAVYPNINTARFCDWLLNYSWFQFSTSQLNTINTVYTAAQNLTSVTNTEYNNFTQTTSWRYQFYLQFANGINYSGSYLANYLNQLLTQPTTAYTAALDALINTLTTDNNIQLLDRLWIFASETSQAAMISVVNPTSTPARIVGTPTFTSKFGIATNANGQCVNLNFTPNLDAVNYTLNSSCVFYYSRTNSTNANADIGEAFSTGCYVAPRNASNQATIRMQNSSNSTIANSNSDKLLSIVRTASNLTTLYRDGVSVGTSSTASANLSNVNQLACAANLNTLSGSARQISIVGYGSGALDQTKLNNAINTFATSIGFNV